MTPMQWTWKNGTPVERANMVRAHSGCSLAVLCEIFGLTEEGVFRIIVGDCWRPEYSGEASLFQSRRERDQLEHERNQYRDEMTEMIRERRLQEADLPAEDMKDRIWRGQCPCCSQTFGELHRHMISKHGDERSAPPHDGVRADPVREIRM